MMICDNIMAGTYPNLLAATKSLAKDKGVAGFYSGWWPGIAGKIPSYGLTWTLFEQIKRVRSRMFKRPAKDIENSLKVLNPNGIILLHDCLPNNHFEQAVPRCQLTWNGDVWKAIVECRVKENIDTYTCYADYGIGVIFNRKNKNPLKLDSQNFSKISFEDYFHKHKEFMNIIEYEDLIKIL